MPLRNAKLLSKVIVGGAIEEISLEKLMADVQMEVDAQREQGVTDERILAECVELKLKSTGELTTSNVPLIDLSVSTKFLSIKNQIQNQKIDLLKNL